MSQKRTSSKVKQKQIQTKMLQQQTKKMQQKLAALKLQVQQQKKLKQANNQESTLTKWKKATNADAPLKDYAKKILADRKQALNKYGINQKKILGAKSFEPVLNKIRSQKKQQQEKDPSRLPRFQINSIVESKTVSIQPQSQIKELPINSIQNNFFKAKINTKQIIHRKNLQQFLQQNFLQQYLPIFKSNEINDLEDLYHLSRQRMNQMNIKPGHQAKIIKRIKQQFDGKKQPNTNNTASSQKLSEQKHEPGEKVSFGYGDGDINQYNNLNKEEQESKMQKQMNNSNLNKKVDHLEQNNVGNDQNGGQDFQSDYEQQNEDQVILTMPEMAEFSLQTGARQSQQQEVQYNCFQCYKKFYNFQQQSSDGRKFCSKGCLNKYLQFMQKKCPQCDQIFYKFNGIYQQGLWFCSIKCSPNQDKIEELFIEWSKNQKGNQQ